MKRILFLAALFFLISSCKKDYEVQNIDTDLLVSAGVENEKVGLGIESERMYPTPGHEITYCDKGSKNEIYIKFKKINAPAGGSTVLAPASCSIDLGELENGEYKITFELNKKKTNGKLIVGTNVELTIDSGSNVKPK